LNDYVEKILAPKFWRSDYANTKTRTIHIPTQNLLVNSGDAEKIFGWYAKRAKFFSAFQKILYQRNELNYVDDVLELTSLSQHFAKILMRYDFWNYGSWRILQYYSNQLSQLIKGEQLISSTSSLEIELPTYLESEESQAWLNEVNQKNSIIQLWEALSALSRTYEETCREWFLPTAHGFTTTYLKT
jgi:hypothetical protein